jgi:hypothetical protein
MADDLQVKFGAETSGVTAGAQEVKAQVVGIDAAVAELATALKGLGDSAVAGFGRLSNAAAASAVDIKAVAASINETREVMIGFGELLIAAFAVDAVVEWTNRVGEAGERARQMGEKLGMSMSQVQEWGAVATLNGRDINQFGMAFTRLTDNLVKGAGGAKLQAAAMRDMGLSAKDALDPTQAVLKVSTSFAEMKGAGDTARAIAEAMALMGRSGADMLPILEQGPAAIQAMMDKGVQFGAVLDSAMNAKVIETNDRLNDLKLHLNGLSEQAFVALAPQIEGVAKALADFAESIVHALQPGSQFQKMVADLRTLAMALAAGFTAYLIPSIVGMTGAALVGSETMAALGVVLGMTATVADLGAAFSLMASAIAGTTAGVWGLTVALLANPLVWVAAAVAGLVAGFEALTGKTDDEKRATDALHQSTDELRGAQADLGTMTKTQIDNEKMLTTISLGLAKAQLAAALATDQLKRSLADNINDALGTKFWDPSNKGEGIGGFIEGTKQSQKAIFDLEGTIDNLQKKLDLLGGAKASKPVLGDLAIPKPPKSSDAGAISDMEALKAKFQEVEDAHSGMIQDMKADELAYWQAVIAGGYKALDGTTMIAKDREAVDQMVHKLSIEEERQAVQEKIALARTAMSEQIAAIKSTLSDQKTADAEAIASIQNRHKRGEISAREAADQEIAIIKDEQAQADAAAREIAQVRINADLLIIRSAQSNTKEYQAAVADMLNASKVFSAAEVQDRIQADKQIQAGNDKTADEYVQKWHTAIDGVVSSFTHGFAQMALGAQSFAKTMQQIGQSILSTMLNAVDRMVSNWIVGEAIKSGATDAGVAARTAAERAGHTQSAAMDFIATMKAVTNNAVVAASAAFKAFASNPLTLPFAPVAAAATFAAVEAFGAMASAAGGYDIPAGKNPLVQTHAEEMILPAKIANPLRNMIDRGAFGGDGGANGGGFGGGGEVHHHHHYQINALDGTDVKRVLEKNHTAHAEAMESLVRRRNGRGFGA